MVSGGFLLSVVRMSAWRFEEFEYVERQVCVECFDWKHVSVVAITVYECYVIKELFGFDYVFCFECVFLIDVELVF